jgi:uncharacterized cupin superfamily protein
MSSAADGEVCAVRLIKIGEAKFEYDREDPEGFRSGMARVGPTLGAEQTGTTVYELPPGQALCPYHYEHAEEEWLLVLEGRPTVRDPEGTHQLEPLDLVFFPTGPDGAHGVKNDTDEPVKVLMYSDFRYPAATVYPDSDKIAVWTRDRADNLIARRSSGVDYWDGEA